MSDKITLEEVRQEVISSTVNHVFSFSRNEMLDLLEEHDALRAQLAERDAMLAEKVLLLAKYGRHSYICDENRRIGNGRCTCGLDAALASLPATAQANAKKDK